MLAAHAAIAIANARLYEQTRELSIVAERNRLALDLHDAVSQKLFGLVLEAEAAATVLERDPAAAGKRVAKLQVLAREALEELRSLVFELRPPELEKDGLGGTLRKHVEVLAPPRARGDRARAGRRAACGRGARPRDLPHRPGGAAERPQARECAARRRQARLRRRRRAAGGGGRRSRLRPRCARDAVAPARADVDGGAGAAARRHARDRLDARAPGRPSA